MRREIFCSIGVLAIMALCVAAAYSQVDDHTILYYSFNQTVGGTIPDDGGDYDGELGGDAATTKNTGGKFGEGLSLDGDGDYIKAGNIGAPEEGTLETWVKIESFQPHNDGDGLASIGNDYGGTGDVALLGVHQASNLNIRFGMYSGGWKWADSGVSVEDLVGAWHHIAGTWGARGLEVWIDGELKGTDETYTGGIPDPVYQAVLIGSNSWNGDIHGVMDEFRVSDIQMDSEFLLSVGVEPRSKLAIAWGTIKKQ